MSQVAPRQVKIQPWWSSRLGGMSVFIVGVGGLGTHVAKQLAQAGVGRLVLCDPDVVEESNLNRGALFTRRHAATKMKKVAAARQALRAIAPATVVDTRPDDFRYAIGLGELRKADLVVSCLDSVADRIALSSRCMLSGSQNGLLDAGLHPWGGEVRHYKPDGPCYACSCSPVDRALPAWHAACGLPGPLGASAPVTAVVASWQAAFALRLLFGEPSPFRTPGPPGEPDRRWIMRIDTAAGLVGPILHEQTEGCPCHDVIDENFVRLTSLSNRATVADLLALAENGEHVQTWNPIDRADVLSPLTLRMADPGSRLQALGIPPAEILPVIRVRPSRHVRYLELKES